MIFFAHVGTLLLIFISSVLTMDTYPKEPSQVANQEDSMQLALRGLKDILLEFECLSCFDFENVLSTSESNANIEISSRERSFLDQPIMIVSIEFEQRNNAQAAITSVLEYFEKSRKDSLKKFTGLLHLKTHEHFLFERMNQAILLINDLEKDIESIKKIPFYISKKQEIKKAKETCSKLLNILFLVRFSSFLDYIDPSGEEYDSLIKYELTNNIYSVAVHILREFIDLCDD